MKDIDVSRKIEGVKLSDIKHTKSNKNINRSEDYSIDKNPERKKENVFRGDGFPIKLEASIAEKIKRGLKEKV